MNYWKKILSLVVLLVVSLQLMAQDVQIRLKDVTLRTAMTELRRQSGYSFVYEATDVNTECRVSVNATTLNQAVSQMIEGQNLTFEIKGKNIILSRKSTTTPKTAPAKKKHTVHGRVVDANGEPIIGATIVEKGTGNGTISNDDGHFTVSVPDRSVLTVSYLGYDNIDVRVAGQRNLNVTLRESSLNLQELVVIGYGVQRKSDLISSVASVKAEDMTRNVSLDVGQMLRGRAAGVQVTTSSAAPGGSSSIQIRGVNSINGGTSPIVVADGVVQGDINNINPNDIESVEVLKDAAAQAIYGARAANGVILITTKRGKEGKTSINYNGYIGFQNVDPNFDVYSPEEFVQYKREAFRTTNGGVYGADSDVFSQTELNSIQNGEYIDWRKEMMRTGMIQNHNISLTTGNSRTKAYVSADYQHQNGIIKETDYRKGNIRINLDQKINKSLSAGVNAFFSVSESRGSGTSEILRDAIICSPLGQVYDAEGNLKLHPTGLQENWNPMVDIYNREVVGKNRNDLINLFFDWEILKGLKYRLNLSRRSWQYKGETYNRSDSKSGSYSGKGNGTVSNQENMEWAVENILSYHNTFGKHTLDGTFVQSWSGRSEYTNQMAGALIPNDMLGIYGIESAEKVTPTMSGIKRRLLSTALRFQYNYDSRYYLTASIRRDGSSVFGADNKWGVFPAVALGWNVYQEKFLKDVQMLSNLKLRLSYGSVGNEAIAPYGSVASADQWDYYTTSRQAGYTPGGALSNPKLKWETTTTLNAALDFGFWKNRLSGTIELYKTRTTDLLVNRSINSSTGYTTMRDNIGEIQNRGIEIQLSGASVRNHDFDLTGTVTFSKNRNKIVKLFGDKDGDGEEDDYPQNNWFIGEPISIYRYYKVVGIWQEDEVDQIPNSAQPTAQPGDVKLWDNGDGILNDEDKFIVSRYPKWTGSLNLQAAYKGFDFSADIYTVQGITRLNPFLYDYSYGGNMRAVFNGIKVDYWTPENPSGTFPRPTTNGQNDMTWLALEDASYWRLQNVQLGYTFPQSITEKLHVNKLRLYMTGQNLLTFTDFHAYSPDQDPSQYPEARSFTFGVQLSF